MRERRLEQSHRSYISPCSESVLAAYPTLTSRIASIIVVHFQFYIATLFTDMKMTARSCKLTSISRLSKSAGMLTINSPWSLDYHVRASTRSTCVKLTNSDPFDVIHHLLTSVQEPQGTRLNLRNFKHVLDIIRLTRKKPFRHYIGRRGHFICKHA